MTSIQRAQVGHRPGETNQPQQAPDEPARLPERRAEQHLHRQAGLSGSIAVALQAATPAPPHAALANIRFEPDCQRALALERFVIGRPDPGPVDRGCGPAHADQLTCWIDEMNF